MAILIFSNPAAHSAQPEIALTAELSAADQAAAGLTKLSADQRAELDRQIAREITLARQGDVTAFAKTFGERRTPPQIAATGLDRLSREERVRLDALVARGVAQRPLPTVARYQKKSEDVVETTTYRPQLHGQVSLTYSTAGGGREFYGGSFTTVYDDPARGLTVGFTYAEYRGKGLLPFYGCGPLAPHSLGFGPEW